MCSSAGAAGKEVSRACCAGSDTAGVGDTQPQPRPIIWIRNPHRPSTTLHGGTMACSRCEIACCTEARAQKRRWRRAPCFSPPQTNLSSGAPSGRESAATLACGWDQCIAAGLGRAYTTKWAGRSAAPYVWRQEPATTQPRTTTQVPHKIKPRCGHFNSLLRITRTDQGKTGRVGSQTRRQVPLGRGGLGYRGGRGQFHLRGMKLVQIANLNGG